ncbi:MFS transporter [Pseudonocardia xinjiangensis]|uniref:MFS transporter n=1 Tax=Pseudonocardia xinjiangensis TaxID=75289 RepID=UPI003D94F041
MPELDRRHKTAILWICCMGLFIVGLDNTIVNLALPSIGRELQASVSSLQWVIDAYTVVLASLLMLAGSTGDRFGRKRVFQIGLVLFSLGSLLCSIAPGIGLLIVFRMLQAVGGSMLNPVALSIITNTFTERRERAKAIGVWGSVVGLSWALGPLFGGVLVDSIGWRSVFWINVPIGIAAVLLVARFVPNSRAARPRPLDPVGQVLLIVLLATLTYAIIEAPGLGVRSPWIIGCAVVTIASAIAFVRYEQRKDQPLLDIKFFRSAPFTGATLIAVGSFGVMAGFLFLNALYLQEVRGFTPLHAGLLTLPMAVMTAVLSPISGRLVGTRGPRLPLLAGGLAIAVGSFLLSGLTAQTLLMVVLAYAVFGVGFGFINPPITTAAVSGMPMARAGVAAAVASTSRQVGATLGVAVLGSVVTARIVGPLSTGFVTAAHLGWLIMTAIGVAMFVIGLVTTSKWALRTAQVFDEPGDRPAGTTVAAPAR